MCTQRRQPRLLRAHKVTTLFFSFLYLLHTSLFFTPLQANEAVMLILAKEPCSGNYEGIKWFSPILIKGLPTFLPVTGFLYFYRIFPCENQDIELWFSPQ